MNTATGILSFLFLSLAVDAGAHGSVIVVDPGGGAGGAALLQSAIDGDILLLRPGDYASAPGSHPQIIDKSLALVVDGPRGSVVLSGLYIASSLTSNMVVVRGLHVAPAPFVGLPSAAVQAVSAGVVWCEDCVFTGSQLAGFPAPGLSSETKKLTLVRCTITGADGVDEAPGVSPAIGGGSGVSLGFGPNAASIHECTIHGGHGGDGDPFSSGGMALANGGAGLEWVGGNPASILGSTILGGDEGDDNPAATQPGAGLLLSITGVDRRDTEIHAGAVNGAGTPNVDIGLFFSFVTNYTAPARSLSVPSPLREGASSALHVQGEPGDGVWLYLGLSANLKSVPAAQGNFILGSLLFSPLFLGTLGPSGLLDWSFQAPHLPTGVDGFLIMMQSVITPSSGSKVVGSGSALVLLDDTL